MKKNIFIVRHAESTANVNEEGLFSQYKKYVIDSSFGITKKGILQAEEAGEKIVSKLLDISHINMYVSPFKRTRETANYLQIGLKRRVFNSANINYIEDPRLIEQDFGDFDFQYRPMWQYISPHSFMINQARFNDPTGRFFARLENGENLLDVYNRVSLFVTTRLERSNSKDNIIVTHGNTQKIFKMFLLGENVESFEEHKGPYPNASVMRFEYNDETGEYIYLGLL